MKTKEEILLDSVGLQPYEFPTTLVYKAMDNYAKEVAIAFALWFDTNTSAAFWDEQGNAFYDTPFGEEMTAEQLFNKFLSEQQSIKQ